MSATRDGTDRPQPPSERRTAGWQTSGVAALAVACFLVYCWLYVLRLAPTVAQGTGDFVLYLASGAAVLAGDSPYVMAHWDYPPLLSFLVAPLAALDFPQAAWIWFAVAHLCLAFAAAWCWQGLGGDRTALLTVAAVWAAAGAIAPSLLEGQINAVLLFLFCLVFWAPGRGSVGAAALGAAVALKLWPAILYWALLVAGRWRRLLVALAWAGALIVGPWAVVALTLDGPSWTRSSSYWMGTPAFLNGSLPAVALRLLDPIDPGAASLPRNWVVGNRVAELSLAPADQVVSVVVAATVLALGLALLWRRSQPHPAAVPTARVGAALVALAMVASPIAWPHYQVLQIPGTALLAVGWLRARRWPALGLLAVAFGVANWTEAVVMGPYLRTYGAGADAPALAWLLSSLPAAAAVVLFVLHLAGLRSVTGDGASRVGGKIASLPGRAAGTSTSRPATPTTKTGETMQTRKPQGTRGPLAGHRSMVAFAALLMIGCAAQNSDGAGRAVQGEAARSGGEGQPAAAIDHDLPLDTIELRPGFSIDVYALVPGARSLTRSPEGVLYVGTRGEGRVHAVVDRDGDQVADEVFEIASGLRSPNGVAWRDGDLYVAEISRILRFPGIDARLADPPQPVVVADDYPSDRSHGWKFIAFGPDGWLYVPVGAPCNICDPDDPIYASITRLRADGSDRQIFAHGIRNTVGFDWHPESGVLWFTDNGRDRMGDDVPPDEINRAPEMGMDFGYPHCHGRDVVDPEFGRPGACEASVPPVAELDAHVAALGIRFYTGEMFPDEYHHDTFHAEHGSWNRSSKIGYRVMRTRLDGERVEEVEPFATGWLQGERAWGRPVDVLVMPDGALLVSDDEAGAIYRISYRDE